MSMLKESSSIKCDNGFVIKYSIDTYQRELNICIKDILNSADCLAGICPRLDKYLSRGRNKPYDKITVETAKQIANLIGNLSTPKILEINISKIEVSPISGIEYIMTIRNGKWVDTLILNISNQARIELFTKAFSKYYNKIKQEKLEWKKQ